MSFNDIEEIKNNLAELNSHMLKITMDISFINAFINHMISTDSKFESFVYEWAKNMTNQSICDAGELDA